MKFFKLDVGAWLDGTQSLTAAERGTYMTILCEMYLREGPVYLTFDQWGTRLNCSRWQAKRHIMRLIATGKLTLDPVTGCLRNERAHSEIMQVKTSSLLKENARAVKGERPRSFHVRPRTQKERPRTGQN